MHDIPQLAYPNGDTPLADGNVLVSEIKGSYVDEVTITGRWSGPEAADRLPVGSSAVGTRSIPSRRLLQPGQILEFNRAGKILWCYHPTSGAGMLDHPSLAELLPNGLIWANDDYRNRVVIIDPRTNQIVWQYGHTDIPGRGQGSSRFPTGSTCWPGGTTPTHPYTG